MKILKKYEKCIFCGSSKLNLSENQGYTHNFYTNSIKNDLSLDEKFFKKMKIHHCMNCFIVQNTPWFSEKISFKIFNQIYGQHNRNWLNIINFFKKGLMPDHGKLFKILDKNFKIRSYCEFNAPFMGLMIDFFDKEYKKNSDFYKNIFNYCLKYLSSRQLVGKGKKLTIKSEKEAKEYLKKLNQLKNKINSKNMIKKTLIIDNSYLTWLYNDNYRSVNSKVLASELFDIEIENFNLTSNSKSYDLFGIFNTLDHTHQPKKILDYALNNSKYVLIYCHSNENLEKQHLFSLTDKFISYLERKKINCLNLTSNIDKHFKSKEIYILCSKFNKINI